MQPLEPAWIHRQETADSARARLVEELRRRGGSALSRSVQDAFARVPRHVFVPEVGPAAAYRDEAFVIKCGPDGLPVSSSSQPAMMAIMLDQLGLEPGHRVLEIGTGTGYNAAVMAEVVGPGGQVVSIDIDPDLIARASAGLAAAGYDQVTVLCADGGYGDPARAPFDRIIVTAGAWDIAPAWLDQLEPGGLLVLPLSVRGIQLSVALRRSYRRDRDRHEPGAAADEWAAMSAWRCGFVPMLGAFAGPETVFRLPEPRPLTAQMADGHPVAGPALQAALAGEPSDEQVVPPLGSPAELADLDLWLTITAAELSRIIILAAPGGWFPMAGLLPFGGLVGNAMEPELLGAAILLPAEVAHGQRAQRAGPDMLIRGFGPGGADLAAYLAGLTGKWAEAGRPGTAELQLTVRPAGAPASGASRPGSTLVLQRPSVSIEVAWVR
ncbi:MAG TPA: methyltransferase domain-containing protein [Streptosporangiaceae bacterium]|jgi:protein-L-isoaspartate(D-aspartate) O-methyltransferase|nr:methyltransferase domain-containing protein [Streptosporangiaceae bacterium]